MKAFRLITFFIASGIGMYGLLTHDAFTTAFGAYGMASTIRIE